MTPWRLCLQVRYWIASFLSPKETNNLSSAREYTPSPRLVVKWLLDSLTEDFSGYSFVDFGSGKGRALLAAAERPFRHVVGVEFCEKLHHEANLNITNYPTDKLQCKNVKSVYADACEFELPDTDCILYFYNPFGAELLNKVVAKALDTAQARSSRMLVIYYNPVHREIMNQHARLRARPLPLFVRMKMGLFSPYLACVYDVVSLKDTAR